MAERLAVDGGKPVRKKRLPFYHPVIGAPEVRAVTNVLRSGWITSGPITARFEQALAKHVSGQPVAAVNSATSGLMLALHALGVGPGDEVITTPLTFVATANVIVHLGARPVFADVDPDSLTLDPRSAARAVTRKTRAIVPVHLAGHPADMTALLRLARKKHLAVVEDAAHAFGAVYRGRPIGSWGDATVFSFHAVKNVTTAEGGAVTSRSQELIQRVRLLANHGLDHDTWHRVRAQRWRYTMTAAGFKANLTDLHAALGLAQLDRFAAFQRRRREIVAAYQRAFRSLPQVQVPPELADGRHAWHLYLLRLRPERLRVSRDGFLEALFAEGISANVHYVPVHLQPYYRRTLNYRSGSLPIAEEASASIVTLPLYPAMTDRDAKDVIAAVTKLLRAYAV